MQARRALLKKLASITDWDTAPGVTLTGETWVETRNTLYCFRDTRCIAVASRNPHRTARAGHLVGMRLVGWLRVAEGRTFFSYEWTAGAAAVLWRPGPDGGEEAMAMTSPTTALKRGRSSGHLQALHDQAPPVDSQTFQRGGSTPESMTGTSRPSFPSFRSG